MSTTFFFNPSDGLHLDNVVHSDTARANHRAFNWQCYVEDVKNVLTVSYLFYLFNELESRCSVQTLSYVVP